LPSGVLRVLPELETKPSFIKLIRVGLAVLGDKPVNSMIS
jgi:hypothetical protein